MGMFRTTLSAAALAAALAGCGSQAVEPPPSPSPITSRTPSPTATTAAPPVMPEAAKAHTVEGAKAFVVYYVDLITYAERTLDTRPVELHSLPACAGCKGGIKAIRAVARQGGHIEGAGQTVGGIETTPIDSYGVVTIFFTLTNSRERVVIPGKKTTIHPIGRTPMIATLVAQKADGWLVSEFRKKP